MNYIPVTEKEKKEMLDRIGAASVDELFAPIPASARLRSLDLPAGISEQKLLQEMSALSGKNASLSGNACFCGAGIYDHFIPSLVGEIINRSEFATAYTPYQPEASQGTLQAVFEYQSLITDLTALDVANASLYDGASATAEAVLLALRSTGRSKILIPETLHPEYAQVVRTYLRGTQVELILAPSARGTMTPEDIRPLCTDAVAALVVQSPNFFGLVEDLDALRAVTKEQGILLIEVVNPLSLGILRSPGEAGVDIAVGEGQVLGNPTGFGGFTFGFMACQKTFSWKMPGRIVGQTTDTQSRRGYVLTLQSREQHIRREKATSNICTNAALNALAGCVYLAGWGPQGLKKLAETNVAKSHHAFDRLSGIAGFSPVFSDQPFFNEFVLRTTKDIGKLQKKLLSENIIGPFELGRFYPDRADSLLFCVTEMRTADEIESLARCLEKI